MHARSGRKRLCRYAMAAILSMAAFFAYGDEYMDRESFLSLAFGDAQPAMHTFWLTDESRGAAQKAVGWTPRGLRVRYWRVGERTAWILEDIGKEKPITLGVVVCGEQIERVEVLAFRESRGWEIRYPFFTGQFSGLRLADDGYLSAPIDGITGATLSVRAVERVARLALWLDDRVQG